MMNTQNTNNDDRHSSVYLGIEHLNLRDTHEALKLGWLNFDSIKPEYQPELRARLAALKAHKAHLVRISKR